MSVTNVHVLYAVQITGGALLDQVDDWNFNAGLRHILAAGDGQVDPTYVAVGLQEPTISFSTTAIATALGACGISGLAIAAANALIAWLQKTAEGGTRASGANHIKAVMNKGILVPRQLTANSDGSLARLAFDAIATYDGTNLPFVLTSSQALTGAPAVGEGFVAGPVAVNGTTLNGVQSITIDFGLQVRTVSGDGQVYPTYCYVASRAPSIRVAVLDPSIFTTLGLSGAAQSGTNSVVYLRKVDEGGTRVADAVAQHISFSIDEGHIHVSGIRGSQGQEIGSEVLITPTWDAAAAIMVINAATAIS